MAISNRAIALVRAAKRAGADAVKLQTYTADTMTLDSDLPLFRLGEDSTWAGRRLYELYQEAHTPWDWHAPLQDVAAEEGIALFSTPFDESAVDFLESLDMPAYKIASFELVDSPLLARVARTGKPVILSTGMASMDEIREAVATLRQSGCARPILLRCASAYPADPGDVHLALMRRLAGELDVETGLSDHSMDPAVAVAAAAMGAVLIEKHFILDRARRRAGRRLFARAERVCRARAAGSCRRACGRTGGCRSWRERLGTRQRDAAPLALRGAGRRARRAVHAGECSCHQARGRACRRSIWTR